MNFDAILMFNFRADRAREILASLVDPGFDGFNRQAPPLSAAVGLTEYSTHLNQFCTALFPQRKLERILGEIVSDEGLTQLRIAETENTPTSHFSLTAARSGCSTVKNAF